MKTEHAYFFLYCTCQSKPNFYEEPRNNFHLCTLYPVGQILLCKSFIWMFKFQYECNSKKYCFFFTSQFNLF